MTNEELVILIHNGQTELMQELYDQNRGMIYRVASRCGQSWYTASVDIDDLMQSGYIALAVAVEAHDDSKGVFTTCLVILPQINHAAG